VLLRQYLIDFQDYFVLIHHLLHLHQYLDHVYQLMVLQVLSELMVLLFVGNGNFHHLMDDLLMMDDEFVDDRIVEEVFVVVHHLNCSLLYHQVQVVLFSFLMVVLLFVEKNQAKNKKQRFNIVKY
jgi:hypothetical protein